MKPQMPTMKFRRHTPPPPSPSAALFPLAVQSSACILASIFARTYTNTRMSNHTARSVCCGPMKITLHGKFESPLTSLAVRAWRYWNKGSSRNNNEDRGYRASV